MKECDFSNSKINITALELRAKILESRKVESFPTNIDGIWIFPGPGTYYEKLKENEQNWKRFMDRDRIRSAVAIMRMITAAKKEQTQQSAQFTNNLTLEDYSNYAPYLIYNGNRQENKSFLEVIKNNDSKIEINKVIILDNYSDENTAKTIENTRDNIKSFFQAAKSSKSPISKMQNVLLVSHSPHFVRIPHYLHKYEKESLNGNKKFKFYGFGVKCRNNVFETFLNSELNKIVQYERQNYLEPDPSTNFVII